MSVCVDVGVSACVGGSVWVDVLCFGVFQKFVSMLLVVLVLEC